MSHRASPAELALAVSLRGLSPAMPAPLAASPRALVLAGTLLGEAGTTMLVSGLLGAQDGAGIRLLDVSRCGLGAGGMLALATLLKRATQLEVLALSFNGCARQHGHLAVAAAVGACASLTELHWAGAHVDVNSESGLIRTVFKTAW